jgi:hypothetical protein
MVNDEVKLLLTYRLTELIMQLEKATGKWTTEGSLSNWEMVWSVGTAGKGNVDCRTRRVSEWRPTETRGPSRKSGPTYEITDGQAHMLHSINTIHGAATYRMLFRNSETVCIRIRGIQGAKTEKAEHLLLESNVTCQQNPYTAVVNYVQNPQTVTSPSSRVNAMHWEQCITLLLNYCMYCRVV